MLASETRKTVFKLSKLNLEMGFTGPRMLGKNLQDERRSINDSKLQEIFQMTLLGRSQFSIDDDQGKTHFLFEYRALAQ